MKSDLYEWVDHLGGAPRAPTREKSRDRAAQVLVAGFLNRTEWLGLPAPGGQLRGV